MVLEELSYLYSGVRIPVSLFEQDKIFVAVCLSKRTDYEVLVRSWMEKILEKYDNNVLDIVYASKEDLLKIGTSYQIFDLIDTLKSATIFIKVWRIYLLMLRNIYNIENTSRILLNFFRLQFHRR